MRYAVGIVLLSLGIAGFFLWSNRDMVRGILPLVRPPLILPEGEPLPFALEQGFTARLYSGEVPGARVLTRDPGGVLVASLSSEGSVVALPDLDGNGKADAVIDIITGLRNPHGLAFYCMPEDGADCRAYIAEEDAVREYAYDISARKAVLKKTVALLPSGGGHSTRSLWLHPNNRDLLVSIGSSCNVCNERDARRASVLAIDLASGAVRAYATGLRNTVFMTTHPVTGEVWGTDMGRDNIGDDIPPDEINILKEGSWYGWPWLYGKNVEDHAFSPDARPSFAQEATPSHIDIPAHSAPLGLAFIPEEGWSGEYRHDLLVAYHGSWNRSIPTGYKVVRIELTPQGTYVRTVDFMSGFYRNGSVLGRPAGLLVEPGGLAYVSDDRAGAIYRITRSTE